eukprot:TRINITY_DN9350_c0_g1_i2.p1 TRINITY_DN9350_c0_g1~~TRINITY_DN9350_c0_g1_i2.p1  ORF type:complete len:139 (+),score=25.77 TRINITY_DN9350_c0_g1_i2:55-417(+)
MRIITHNMLVCNVKGCSAKNYPLHIKATQLVNTPSDFNPEFITHMIPKLDWPSLVLACKDLNIVIPEQLPTNLDQDTLKKMHDILVDVHIQEGSMVCSNCSREFPITNGVPNMLLTEDEV